MPVHLSPRGIPLVFIGTFEGHPVLTVENYCKWYSLFLVTELGVSTVGFGSLEDYSEGHAPYADHVPNPAAVQRLCNARGWSLCNESLEIMVGRWAIEVLDIENLDTLQRAPR